MLVQSSTDKIKHQIRNHLTIILSEVSLVENSSTGKTLDVVSKQIRRIKVLLNDLD